MKLTKFNIVLSIAFIPIHFACLVKGSSYLLIQLDSSNSPVPEPILTTAPSPTLPKPDEQNGEINVDYNQSQIDADYNPLKTLSKSFNIASRNFQFWCTLGNKFAIIEDPDQ